MNLDLCIKCKGKGLCGKPCPIINKFKASMPKPKLHFSGNSPPEIFVGRHNYPNINTGILAPQEHIDEAETLSMPEQWHSKNFSIEQILNSRGKLIYGRFKSSIKSVRLTSTSSHEEFYNLMSEDDSQNNNKTNRVGGWALPMSSTNSKSSRPLQIMQEISMAHKPVDTEIFLKKLPNQNVNINKEMPIIGNPAPLLKARLQENPKVHKKVDYLTNDYDIKSVTAIKELYKSKIPVSNIIKILSAGLLGIKTARRLVPTRWAITATDDTLSKEHLKIIKYFPEISEFYLFNSEYLGNHYEIILLPDKFSFEVIEAKIPGSVWNPNPKSELYVSIDYEFFHGRKTYASNVTGAYYANKLALTEFLIKIKRQASCLVLREARPEYYAPCGVGILRQTTRAAFQKKPEKFSTLNETLQTAQKRLMLPIKTFTQQSNLLKEFGKQTHLSNFY